MSFTENRELSWLKFNERVLGEAFDPSVPLLERLKFVSIFTSNLDEFVIIRGGSLYDLSLVEEAHIDNKSGMTPQEQIEGALRAIVPLYKKRDLCMKSLEVELRQRDIFRLTAGELDGQERKYVHGHFKTFILPVLSPLIVDVHHPFPHLENKSLHIVAMLKSKNEHRFGIIPVPRLLPRLIFLPGDSMRYLLIEDIILDNIERYLKKLLRLREGRRLGHTRNADINPDDEAWTFEGGFSASI